VNVVPTADSPIERLRTLALTGVGIAFAWIAVSVFFGLGSPDAHANDDEGAGGLLGGATSIVDETVSRTTDAVTSTVSTVTEPVATVVETVQSTAPAPVAEPVKDVAKVVEAVAETVTAPVAEIVSNDVVSTAVTPVVDVVESVPVVGAIVDQTGAGDAVKDVAETTDNALGSVSDSTTEVVEAVDGSIDVPPLPTAPAAPSTPVVPAIPDLDLDAVTGEDAGAVAHTVADLGSQAGTAELSATADAASFAGFTGVSGVAVNGATAGISGFSASIGTTLTMPSMGELCPAQLSAGSNGAGPGAWAFLALFPFAAHRAWVRRHGAGDDDVPPAPFFGTDVSPD
jgi:hypothetical protein